MFNPAYTLIIFTLFFNIFTSVQAVEKPSNHYGVHGMTLFGGKDGLFASHLPMYHQPHNVQMIMQFHFANEKVENSVRQQLQQQSSSPQQLWTIVPKPFDLMTLHPKMSDELPRLHIEVVEGHFERGGNSQFTAQKIIIDKVLLFSTLNMEKEQPKSASAQYQKIAVSPNSPNQFLIKRLGNRPEADHLLRVLNYDLSKMSQLSVPIESELTESGLTESIHPSTTAITEALGKQNYNHDLSAASVIEIYLETRELQ
ncbi:hypothetical protein [Shewanella sp. 10N.286.48.B5]|uniref:hypothetical protein n=1 Tax=Shewanella sp. 10N.286.48.B5 TaxID=1880834 RepID=UPI000C824B76|nr:hypothetical protein [Shewanella sp. 10N.286.48.B5]PMH86132.1 hypothetical protein BCU57_11600 [Shewanella sp. 10N.286.48.B5]